MTAPLGALRPVWKALAFVVTGVPLLLSGIAIPAMRPGWSARKRSGG